MAQPTRSEESKLPLELEQRIFEIAAHSRPAVIRQLMLVAWRVKIWLEPSLYRVIFVDGSGARPIKGLPAFTNDALLRLIDEKRKALLENARHLIFQDGLNPSHFCRLNAIMAACTGVTHLYLHSNKILESHELAALSAMPALRVLGVHISRLFKGARMNFAHAVFRNITHLEVLDTKKDSNVNWSQLTLIPNLTHLAFSEMRACFLLLEAVIACPRMKALVFLCTNMEGISLAGRRFETRFVTLKLPKSNANWQYGGLMGRDYWTAVDRFIDDRRAGRIRVPRE